MTYFQVKDGEIIEPEHMNAVVNQGVIPYLNAAARTNDTALVKHEGMTTYLQDVNRYETWTGTAWSPLLPTSTYSFADAAARTAAVPVPFEGMITYLQDVNRHDTWTSTAWEPLIPVAPEPRVGLDYCMMVLSGATPMAAPVNANKLIAPYTSITGSHPEWGNLTTGEITLPTSGVYTLQWTGAVSEGGGWVNFTLGVNGLNNRITGNESERSTALPDPYLLGTYITYEFTAGTKITAGVYCRNHTLGAAARVWGTLLVSSPKVDIRELGSTGEIVPNSFPTLL